MKQEKVDWLPVLPHARRLRRGTSLPDDDRQGRPRRRPPGLVDHQGVGNGVQREPLGRAGQLAPHVVGLDARSIRKGHICRIGGGGLARRRPIGFGGKDRSDASMDECYQGLGSSKSKKIRRAVMDRWKAVRHATLKPESALHHRPQIHTAVAPGAPEAGWPETAAQGDQTFEHGLPSSRGNSGSAGTMSGTAGRVASSRTGERH